MNDGRHRAPCHCGSAAFFIPQQGQGVAGGQRLCEDPRNAGTTKAASGRDATAPRRDADLSISATAAGSMLRTGACSSPRPPIAIMASWSARA